MAYEPKWASRLRAYRAENNAQFGGASPEEMLPDAEPADGPRKIRGITAARRYASLSAYRGGNPIAQQAAAQKRRAQQQIQDEAAMQAQADEAERRARDFQWAEPLRSKSVEAARRNATQSPDDLTPETIEKLKKPASTFQGAGASRVDAGRALRGEGDDFRLTLTQGRAARKAEHQALLNAAPAQATLADQARARRLGKLRDEWLAKGRQNTFNSGLT